jgi:predicted neutral ceramidase superfamily lipid hydrolase
MEKEYSISVGTKTFYGILAFVIFVFSIFLLTISNSKKITLILIPLIFLIISALIVINFIKRKILITEKSILSNG